MEKTLTISIAAYNVGNYLETAIRSLICDDALKRMEIIIVNDGSTDNTLDIAMNYQAQYCDTIKVINKENGGYGSTINSAIKVASGKYFKQLDGDDWYEKVNIGGFIEYLATIESDLVLTPYKKYFEESNDVQFFDDNKSITRNQQLVSEAIFGDSLAMHELAIKTELLIKNNISITENCFYTDNEYTFLPLINAKTVSRYDKLIYVYRIGREGQSISLAGARKHYQDTMKVAYSIISEFERIKELNNKDIIWKKINYIIDVVYTYYLCSNSKNAKYDLMQFDKDLKTKHGQIYQETMQIRKIFLLRKTSFRLFDIIGKKISTGWK